MGFFMRLPSALLQLCLLFLVLASTHFLLLNDRSAGACRPALINTDVRLLSLALVTLLVILRGLLALVIVAGSLVVGYIDGLTLSKRDNSQVWRGSLKSDRKGGSGSEQSSSNDSSRDHFEL